MVWWFLLASAVVALLLYGRKGQNAVWGTATLAALIGLGIALYQPGFDWWTVGKTIVIGTFIGVAFELLPLIARRSSR